MINDTGRMNEQVYLHYGWECTCCLAKGEVRVEPDKTCNQIERSIEDDHRKCSPQCPKLRYYVTRLEDEHVYTGLLGG